jgi:dTDP-4-dehydrorhamnose reductase
MILGCTGLIGHQIYNHFSLLNEYEVLGISNSRIVSDENIRIDLQNPNSLKFILQEFKPNIIINCVGILIRESMQNPLKAILLNALLPHKLIELSDEINAKLIHISTDCVFSGNKGNYGELDVKDGISIYSKSKALGEINNSRHLTLRTSVIGPEIDNTGDELFNWFMLQEGQINGYDKSIWSGVTTFLLAQIVHKSLELNLTGIYNVTSPTPISKYELLHLLNTYKKNKNSINKIDGIISDKCLVDTRQELNFEYPNYYQMVKEMMELTVKNDLYKHYKISLIDE